MITKAVDWQRTSLESTDDVSAKVTTMLSQIKAEGDKKIDQLAMQFDNIKPTIVKLKPFEEYDLDDDLAESIKLAHKRIEAFATFQLKGVTSDSFTDDFGTFGQVVSPIEKIGAYIPGGRFPLISTALMTLVPAKVAGSKIRVACSPSINPALLAAASLAGATEFIQIGGVQAIAALAYGYKQTSAVDLIVGPGNIWVNEAKKQVQGSVKIDGLAGPSELLALCDANQPVDWLAWDALAQAEHDPLACSLIVSDDQNWLTKLSNYIESNEAFSTLIANKQIELIQTQSIQQAIQFSEDYAPEHLMLCHGAIGENDLNNYGSLFVGANSAVALGDYITGPNHTLPTLGFARQTGGLSVNTFVRIKTIQQVTDHGRKALSKSAMPLANAEGLVNHYESLKIRC
jgi:histidinol dehydrogenase